MIKYKIIIFILLSITIFQILGKNKLDDIEQKLKKTKKKIEKKSNPITGDYEDLVISIEEIENNEKRIQGKMKYDSLESFEARDGMNYYVKTKSVDFTFMHSSGLYLLIHASGRDVKVVEQNFDRLVFLSQPPTVLPCDIPPPVMSTFLEANNCNVFSCNWDGLDLPRINGTNLKGTGIHDTVDFRRFDDHGQKKNVMFNYPEENVTLSINRKASIHFYTGLTRDEQESFVKSQILPLCR